MAIPFIDLKSQLKLIEPEVRANIDKVLGHCQFIMGPEVTELEAKLAEFAQTKFCLACSSGTDALLMPLMAWGVGPGDAVFTTPFTFIATAEVIALTGATPVFVDVDPRTFNIDPLGLERAILAVKHGDPSLHPLPHGYKELTPKAVIPVDLFGLSAEYDRILAIGQAHGLKVLGDAAQSFGAMYRGRKAAAVPPVSATSFFPAKPLGCYGDGGAVCTDDADLVEAMKSIRVHGMGQDRYHNVRVGLNARFDTMQAAVMLPKLRIFPQELDARQRIAEAYTEGLKDVAVTPLIPDHCRSAWAQYSILVDDRPALQKALSEKGIPTMVYYPIPVHLQPVFAHLAYKPGDLPVCEGLSQRIVSLPMHPYLSDEDQRTVVAAARAALKS